MTEFMCKHPFISFFIIDSILTCVQNCVICICGRYYERRKPILLETVSRAEAKFKEVKDNEKDQ